MNYTQQCRAESSWKKVGELVFKLPKYVYRVPCIPGSKMVDHLGAIKERADGRWNWWRFTSNYHPTWSVEGQGVTDSQVGAMDEVLLGWVNTEFIDEIDKDFQAGHQMTSEQADSLREALTRKPSEVPAKRLPSMSERDRIDNGYVHVSHATRHLYPRNDI